MAASTQTPSYLSSHPRHREMCIRFASRASLLSGFARAQREPWIDDCRIDVPRNELWVRMAGGSPARPKRRRLGGARVVGFQRPGRAVGG